MAHITQPNTTIINHNDLLIAATRTLGENPKLRELLEDSITLMEWVAERVDRLHPPCGTAPDLFLSMLVEALIGEDENDEQVWMGLHTPTNAAGHTMLNALLDEVTKDETIDKMRADLEDMKARVEAVIALKDTLVKKKAEQ